MDIEKRNLLVLEHLPLVREIARRMKAHLPTHFEYEDLIQEGTKGLLFAVERWDPGRGPLEDLAPHWIRLRMLDYVRAKTWQGLTGTKLDRPRFEEIEPETPAPVSNDTLALREAVRELPPKERRVIEEHYFEELTQEEIGRGMQLDQPRVSEIHHRALRRMRESLSLAA